MRFGFLQLSSQGRAEKIHEFVRISPVRIAQGPVFTDFQEANAVISHHGSKDFSDLGESHTSLVGKIRSRKFPFVENIGVEVHQN